MSDVGVNMVMKIVDEIKKEVRLLNIKDPKEINEIIIDKMFVIYANDSYMTTKINYAKDNLTVILMVGVNGAGKTTTIAKLAHKIINEEGKSVIVTQNGKNIYPEEIELLLGKVDEIKECMVYGKQLKEEDKELTITVKVIPNYEKIEEKHGKDLSEEKIHDIIWNEIKQVNRKLTSYKAIKRLEIKKDEFEKTTTMKIKRYAEMKKDN